MEEDERRRVFLERRNPDFGQTRDGAEGAGVAVACYEFPYQRTFDAIAAATDVLKGPPQSQLSISVRKFQAAFNRHRDAKPLAPPKPAPDAMREALDARQRVVIEWGERCFGADHMRDKIVRAARFFEEAAELVQAIGLSRDHAMRAFGHVYSRPAGTPAQEAGGVANTLMALCGALDLSFDECQQAEIDRCLAKDPAHFAKRNEAKLREVDALSAPVPSPDGAGEFRQECAKAAALLRHAATTMQNDDYSKPQTEERARLAFRRESILDASELLDRLSLSPSPAVAAEPVAPTRDDFYKFLDKHTSLPEVTNLYLCRIAAEQYGWFSATPPVRGDREAIARALFKNRSKFDDKATEAWFQIYATDPAKLGDQRMCIWRAYSDAEYILSLYSKHPS